jgi:hypothetical protein
MIGNAKRAAGLIVFVAAAGAAIERCMRSGTPQGEAVWPYAITGSMAAREAVPRDHPTPQPPKPQLRIIDGGRS